jgi:probable F420-dependent oxidoreductase
MAGRSADTEGQARYKGFRFGVSARGGQSRSEWIEKARKIEALGYDTLTVPDHLADMIAPMPALISAAEATKALRVGTYVLNNDLRHPVLLARDTAAVDLLTDGRLELGLGAGSIRSEYNEAGLSFDEGQIRVARLAEAVTIIKGLLKGERLTFSGQHYRVTGHAIEPLPAQKPHPPILIGGNGRKLLALAAREADIVGFSGITFRDGGEGVPDLSGWRAAGLDARVKLVREAAGAVRFAQLELSALVQRVIVTADRLGAAEALSGEWAQLSPEEFLASPFVLMGSIDQIVEDLLDYRQRWGITYYVVHEPYAEALAPVAARLAGRQT